MPYRQHILTGIAILFHVIGLLGIAFFKSERISLTTPFHLLLMFGLLVFSYNSNRGAFIKWAIVAYLCGFWAEWVGVHTGWLFGSYSYGDVLGTKWLEIPLIIGVNWIVVIAGAIAIANRVTKNKWWMPICAATIATAYDWLLEPVAIRLEYWQWAGDDVPMYNYISWWLVSLLPAMIWQKMELQPNQFSLNLLIVQVLFFIALRILL